MHSPPTTPPRRRPQHHSPCGGTCLQQGRGRAAPAPHLPIICRAGVRPRQVRHGCGRLPGWRGMRRQSAFRQQQLAWRPRTCLLSSETVAWRSGDTPPTPTALPQLLRHQRHGAQLRAGVGAGGHHHQRYCTALGSLPGCGAGGGGGCGGPAAAVRRPKICRCATCWHCELQWLQLDFVIKPLVSFDRATSKGSWQMHRCRKADRRTGMQPCMRPRRRRHLSQ